MLKFFKKNYIKLRYEINDILYSSKNSLRIDWYGATNNFGDVLNPLLVRHLTGKKILQIRSNDYQKEHFFIIGSILDRATQYTNVWGTGFISKDSKCNEKPKNIYAVRGPKTRDKLLQDGILCPEIYGDPALLLPRIYSPKIKKKYKLGIIPHYIDKENSWIESIKNEPGVKIINIQENNPLDFVDILFSCEKIASSSLHGIIVADAYNIPSTWIELSNNVTGNGFKFIDYFLSVGRTDKRPFKVLENSTIDDIMQQFYEYKISIDLDKLLNAAPFQIDIHPIIRKSS